MAFWYRKGTGVYVYIMVDGRQWPLPRAATRHLDHESESNIRFFVEDAARRYEAPKRTFDPGSGDDTLTRYVDDWFKFREARGKDIRTLRGQRAQLLNHVLPFFLTQDPPVRDPNAWPASSVRLLPFLQDRLSAERIRQAYVALRSFWAYLSEEGVIVTDKVLRLRNPPPAKKSTPLARVISPDEVLTFAKTPGISRPLILMALLGYFFSLRPNEIFALRKRQFRAGTGAAGLECCKTAAQYGLFDRLAVRVESQRNPAGDEKAPKTAVSKAWVACFNKEAAELVVGLLKDTEPDALLFNEYRPDWYLKMWAAGGIKDTVLKDMRRASLYWLGHKIAMQPLHLRHHARHARFETTLLYVRRPDEETGSYVELDLTS
jgi:integrase